MCERHVIHFHTDISTNDALCIHITIINMATTMSGKCVDVCTGYDKQE
jgi:hypothetical protein